MVTKIKSELLPLTRELAIEFLQMAAFPGERDKRPVRLKFFQTHLRNHTFRSPNWAKAIIEGIKEERPRMGSIHPKLSPPAKTAFSPRI
jgi:hypothetical protein